MTIPRISHRLRLVGEMIEIETIGIKVIFHPKNKDATLKALIQALKEYGDDVTGDDAQSLGERQNLDRQLNNIYRVSEVKLSRTKPSLEELYTATLEHLPNLIEPNLQSLEITHIVGNALLRQFHFKTMKDTRQLYRYDPDKGIYVSDGVPFIEDVIKSYHFKLSKHQINEIIYHVQTSTFVDREEFVGAILDNMLHVQNGWLNMDTEKLEPHTPARLTTSKLATEFNPYVAPKVFSKMIYEALEGHDIGELLKAMGNILIPDCRYEKATLMIGAGHNRKGSIIFAIEMTIGLENCCHVSLQEISDDKFATAEFYGKMANLVADLNSQKVGNTGRFKELVSGDVIRGQEKHKPAFPFRSSAKMWYSTNDPPATNDQTNAFWRRWCILVFRRSFERDPTLQARLAAPLERSGILNVMLRGRRKILREDFDDVPIEKIRFVYNQSASIIKEFLHEKCIIDLGKENYATKTIVFQDAYANYCKEKGTKDIDIRQLGEELARLGIENKQRGPRAARERYYIGIMLKAKLQEEGSTTIEATITTQVMEYFMKYLQDNKVTTVHKSRLKTYLGNPPVKIDTGQAEHHIMKLVREGRILEDEYGALRVVK